MDHALAQAFKALNSRLDDICTEMGGVRRLLLGVLKGEIMTNQALTDIEAALQADTDATNAVATLINTLLGEVEANKLDPVQLQAVIDHARANAARSAKLVTDNTPAATPGPVPPVVDPAPAPPVAAPPTDPSPTP